MNSNSESAQLKSLKAELDKLKANKGVKPKEAPVALVSASPMNRKPGAAFEAGIDDMPAIDEEGKEREGGLMVEDGEGGDTTGGGDDDLLSTATPPNVPDIVATPPADAAVAAAPKIKAPTEKKPTSSKPPSKQYKK